MIGYGFGDAHVNREMAGAGLGVLLMDPAGADRYRRANAPVRPKAMIEAKSRLDAAFERGIVGACGAPLREEFRGANLHHENLLALMQQ